MNKAYKFDNIVTIIYTIPVFQHTDNHNLISSTDQICFAYFNCLYSLLNFLSYWIVGALTCQHVPAKKKENDGGAPAASLMPKSYQRIWRVKESVFLVKNVVPCLLSFLLSLWRRKMIRFSQKVGDFLPKRKGKKGVLRTP